MPGIKSASFYRIWETALPHSYTLSEHPTECLVLWQYVFFFCFFFCLFPFQMFQKMLSVVEVWRLCRESHVSQHSLLFLGRHICLAQLRCLFHTTLSQKGRLAFAEWWMEHFPLVSVKLMPCKPPTPEEVKHPNTPPPSLAEPFMHYCMNLRLFLLLKNWFGNCSFPIWAAVCQVSFDCTFVKTEQFIVQLDVSVMQMLFCFTETLVWQTGLQMVWSLQVCLVLALDSNDLVCEKLSRVTCTTPLENLNLVFQLSRQQFGLKLLH